jgi:hypothetical protein
MTPIFKKSTKVTMKNHERLSYPAAEIFTIKIQKKEKSYSHWRYWHKNCYYT